MSVGDQIGARIREKRVQLRIRQSQLAKMVGVSPSYLNLIEHNRRRIGGKLLTDLAEALAIDVDLLSEDGKSSKGDRKPSDLLRVLESPRSKAKILLS